MYLVIIMNFFVITFCHGWGLMMISFNFSSAEGEVEDDVRSRSKHRRNSEGNEARGRQGFLPEVRFGWVGRLWIRGWKGAFCQLRLYSILWDFKTVSFYNVLVITECEKRFSFSYSFIKKLVYYFFLFFNTLFFSDKHLFLLNLLNSEIKQLLRDKTTFYRGRYRSFSDKEPQLWNVVLDTFKTLFSLP